MCKHWLPTAPEGCGFHPTRCSQDPVEAYFSYIRSAGGSSHPTFAECITAGAGRVTNQTLASSSNNGGGKKAKRVFDNDISLEIPLYGRPGGTGKRPAL